MNKVKHSDIKKKKCYTSSGSRKDPKLYQKSDGNFVENYYSVTQMIVPNKKCMEKFINTLK